MAALAIWSAAAMYFSIKTGASESTSPILSKPQPTSSVGKSSAGRRSTPTRSQTVLLYSARFSRRAVTRPGSGLWLWEGRWGRDSIHSSTALTVSGSGRGRPAGGISPRRSFPNTFSRISPPLSAAPGVRKESSCRPAVFSVLLWQKTQLSFKKGRTIFRKAAECSLREAFEDMLRGTRAHTPAINIMTPACNKP